MKMIIEGLMCHFSWVTYLIFKRDYGDHATTPSPEISNGVPFLFLSLEMYKIHSVLFVKLALIIFIWPLL